MANPSEAEDVRRILGYLELEPGSPEIQQIVGLTTEDLERLLRGESSTSAARRSHIRVVASIVRILAETRSAATGTASRGRPATDWLVDARIRTGSGTKSPLEILADEALAREALDELSR
jgi:hypothetical protein